MPRCRLAILPVLMLAAPLAADETKMVTDPDGQTWREVHRTLRHPQTVTQCVDQQRTVYQEKYDVQMCDTYRTYQVPVTEYQWESYWVGRFNPFVQPYLAQRLVPRTRWETRTEVVKVPVTQRNIVPVTQTVRVPITTERVVDQDLVISRQLVSPQTQAIASTPPTNNQGVGGMKSFDGRRPTTPGPAASDDSTFSKTPSAKAQITAKNGPGLK